MKTFTHQKKEVSLPDALLLKAKSFILALKYKLIYLFKK